MATQIFTVRKNGVDQALTCTLTGTANGIISDTTHSFTCAAGDTLSLKVVGNANAAALANVVATMKAVAA